MHKHWSVHKTSAPLFLSLFAAAWAPSVAAMDVDVGGRAHLSLDHLNTDDESSQYLNTNSSRINLSASTELDDGLRAEAQYEARVALDDGDADPGLIQGARESYLGLAGEFGAVRAGRLTAPMQVHMDRFQMFGDQVGDAGIFLGGGGAVNRYGNVVAYSTSDWWAPADPWRVTVGVAPASGDEKDEGALFGVDYEDGPLFVGLGVNYFGENSDALGENEDDMVAAQVFSSYQIGSSRLIGAVQVTRNRDGVEDDADDSVFLLGASHDLTPDTTAKAQIVHYSADARDSDSTMVAIGVDRFLNEQTRVYVAAAATANDDEAEQVPWGWGHADRSNPDLPDGVEGETAAAASVGMRYDF